MFTYLVILSITINIVRSDIATEDVEFLNELTLDKLLRLKGSLHEIVSLDDKNTSLPEQSYLERFGAQAMAMKGPIKRIEYEDDIKKKYGHSKISNIFSMSVTTLAFLAFGGYLLCLIVQAVKSKKNINPTVTQPTFFLSAGIKKKPQPQFASYGRRRRDNRYIEPNTSTELSLPPDELFSALLQLCEGYAKWNGKHGNF